MAKMGSRNLKSNPLLGKATGVHRPTPGGSVTPFATGTIVTGVLCTPTSPNSGSPIMPEGFITYTGLMPSFESFSPIMPAYPPRARRSANL